MPARPTYTAARRPLPLPPHPEPDRGYGSSAVGALLLSYLAGFLLGAGLTFALMRIF